MNRLQTILLVAATFLVVFLEARVQAPRSILGAQIDLLPSLVVYAALSAGIPTVSAVAILGGFWRDSLSANPLGSSVLPLLCIGLIIHHSRGLLLRSRADVQFVLGLAASTLVPPLNLLLLLIGGYEPLLGWWFPWRWLVLSLGGGLFTPIWFILFDRLDRALSYAPTPTPGFRPDREIDRGRDPHAHH